MKVANKCTGCGSTELIERNGFYVCVYCQSKFVPQASDSPPKGTLIGISSDIQALLEKCKADPANRRRYANLILDIDPTNPEAMRFLY